MARPSQAVKILRISADCQKYSRPQQTPRPARLRPRFSAGARVPVAGLRGRGPFHDVETWPWLKNIEGTVLLKIIN